MSFFYGGKLFDKRGCYVILPASPFGRFDSNDNTAEADEEIEVLEGPEVEIVGSCDDSILTKFDMDSCKSDSENVSINDATADHEIVCYQPGTEPDNKYYEVEAIIAGPKKRREHLFKLCYKVRWKGYGPEADTWQPLADLANVQDMIEEFKKEKAQEAKQKRKQKPPKEVVTKEIIQPVSAASSDIDDESQTYDPEYGTVKDKFWKDLELGRVDHYTDLFTGDMYSKIKGCQRTAHAEAVANIHKQQLHGKPVTQPLVMKSSPPVALPKLTTNRHRGRLGATLAKSALSPGSTKSHLSIANKTRKRTNDPFSAKGYTSSKRSRRSREMKCVSLSPEKKRACVSSVTSETMGIVTTTSPVLTPPVVPSTRTVPFFHTEPGLTTITYSRSNILPKNYKLTDVENESDCVSRMTVSSETMLTVTTETKILDMSQLIKSEQDLATNQHAGESQCINGEASSNDSLSDFQEACGATSSENIPASSDDSKRSTLDTQSEASGAVERSHDEECLWGGACNRSDCRANRRRNMKNGKGQTNEENEHMDDESAQNSPEHGSNNENSVGSNERMDVCGNPISRDKPTSSPQSKNSTPAHVSNSSVPKADSPSSKTQRYGSIKPSTPPLLLKRTSSTMAQTYSSDSSFEEVLTPSAPLCKDTLKGTFSSAADAQTHHTETSSIPGAFGIRKNSEISERPGLFSDNNSAFSFVRQDFGFSSNHSAPLSAGNINMSSPGKENFSSSLGGPTMSVPGSRDRLHSMMEVDSVEPHFDLSLPTQTRGFADSHEMRSRKRTNELSQPLEKIPSPNSRRDSDVDRRISTLTCDELEDLVEQGEERLSAKEVSFVTNADLLQAVYLGKAEVVKRAIRQPTLSERKLDFEQPDNTGLTLLMRAVQKGALAIVEMLLEYGVDVNAQQTNGSTALMYAAEQNAVCLLALLLKYGANSSLYTIHSDQAETALMKAIKRQHKEVVSLMLRVGVNIAAPTCTSISATDLAVERRNPQVEALVVAHCQRLEQAFRSRVLVTLEETAELMEPLFPLQCFPLRESHEFVVKFNSNIHPVAQGEGFLLFIAHTKINDKGVRCRFHGSCPIGSVTLNGVKQTPLTKEVNFVTSCHPIIPGCNTLVIHKLEDYTSKAKLTVQAFRAKLLPC